MRIGLKCPKMSEAVCDTQCHYLQIDRSRFEHLCVSPIHKSLSFAARGASADVSIHSARGPIHARHTTIRAKSRVHWALISLSLCCESHETFWGLSPEVLAAIQCRRVYDGITLRRIRMCGQWRSVGKWVFPF